MAVRNFWSLEPGEAIFAEELQKRYKNTLALYFPLKDVGTDLLGVKKKSEKQITFQIKESRYYDENSSPPRHSAWHQLSKMKFMKYEDISFYVFIIYLPEFSDKRKRISRFEKHFIIIPRQALLEKIKFKKPNKKGTYNFYFRINREGQRIKITEHREKDALKEKNPKAYDYSKYHNAWNLIKKSLKR